MKNKAQTNNKRGFTLIELLVVIAIIGILSGIGLVSLNGAREKARDAQRYSDLGQIRTALAVYFDSNNQKYPMEITGLDAGGGSCVGKSGTNVWTYLANAPGTFVDIHASFPINVFTGGSNATYSTPLVPGILGSVLTPPTAVGTTITGDSLYCYDVNGDGLADDRSKYFLYTKFESGGKEWYWLDSDGRNGKTATAHAIGSCIDNGVAADVCNW